MLLTNEQVAIAKRMQVGFSVAILAFTLGALLNSLFFPENLTLEKRLALAMFSSLVPVLALSISIGRLAKHRFFNAKDIGAGTTNSSTARARVLQSILQNTLEQTVLAFIAYTIWSIIMSNHWLSIIPIASLLFGIGRILFFVNYEKGASARALGSTFTFYPTLLMIITLIINSLYLFF